MMAEQANNKQYYKFTVFFRIAIPIMIQGLVFQLQNLVDKSFLGNLKTEYLTAIGVTQSPFFMTITIIMAITTGLSIIVGHLYGAGKLHEMKDSIASTITFNIFFSLLLLILWYIFGEFALGLINVDSSIMPYALTYLRIIAIYLPFFAIDGSIQGTLQAFGKTKPIMYVGIIKVFLNIFLDWVLIFGKFGLPAMELEGAAIATLAANIISSLILIIYYTYTSKLPIQTKFRELFSFNWKSYTKIAAVGLPTGMEYFLWHVGNVVIIAFLNQISIMGVAIYVLLNSVGFFALELYFGISKTTMTITSQQLGKKDYESTRPIMIRSIIYDLVIVTFMAAIILLFTEPILDIFTDDLKLISLALPLVIYMLLNFYPKSINVLIGHGIRATGNTRWMMYTQIIGTILVIALSYVLVNIYGLGLEAIFITVLVDESVRSIINSIYFLWITNPKRIEDKVISVSSE